MIYVYVYAFSVRSVPGARQQVNALRFSGQAVEAPAPGARPWQCTSQLGELLGLGIWGFGFWF